MACSIASSVNCRRLPISSAAAAGRGRFLAGLPSAGWAGGLGGWQAAAHWRRHSQRSLVPQFLVPGPPSTRPQKRWRRGQSGGGPVTGLVDVPSCTTINDVRHVCLHLGARTEDWQRSQPPGLACGMWLAGRGWAFTWAVWPAWRRTAIGSTQTEWAEIETSRRGHGIMGPRDNMTGSFLWAAVGGEEMQPNFSVALSALGRDISGSHHHYYTPGTLCVWMPWIGTCTPRHRRRRIAVYSSMVIAARSRRYSRWIDSLQPTLSQH